ncbi:MAG: ribulose-phosphate 3-epimerase [Actinobacteria bacterium]|nr:MAG: ribulose-phosphate 3-epimerase [Actinomycetota bacterium]
MPDRILMTPSILSADFTRLAEAVETVEAAGADMIHVDVMDGHFVPNLTIGPPVVKALKRVASTPLDVHIMIDNPDDTVDWYLDAGADSVTVHVETARDLARVLARIREKGAKAAVTLNPATPVESIADALPLVDMVLVMSVVPGFGGQSFIPESVEKVRRVVAMCAEAGVSPLVQVDGGITVETAPLVAAVGAQALVAGNAVFAEADPGAAMNAIRAAAEAGRS